MPKHPFICAIVSDNSAAEQIELCQHSHILACPNHHYGIQ